MSNTPFFRDFLAVLRIVKVALCLLGKIPTTKRDRRAAKPRLSLSIPDVPSCLGQSFPCRTVEPDNESLKNARRQASENQDTLPRSGNSSEVYRQKKATGSQSTLQTLDSCGILTVKCTQMWAYATLAGRILGINFQTETHQANGA